MTSNITNRMKGKAQEIGGAIQKNVGKAVGDDDMELEGAVKELEGEARQEVAKTGERVKGAIEVVVGAVKAGLGEAVGNERLQAAGTIEKLKGKARTKLNQ